MQQSNFTKLNSRGLAHMVLPALVVLVTAIAGTYLLVSSRAATVKKTSTYFVYSAGGTYKYVSLSSTNFSQAKCSAKGTTYNIGGTKRAVIETPSKDSEGKYQPLQLVCTTPKAGAAYQIGFFTHRAPATNPPAASLVPLGYTTNVCAFVHAVDAPNAKGVTHTLPKAANGSCQKTGTPPAAPEAPATATPKPKPAPKPPKPKVKKLGNLLLPPNFRNDLRDQFGYYVLPESPGNETYYVLSPTMPGGRAAGESAPVEERHGTKTLIAVFYTVAKWYDEKYPNSQLVAGDLNAPGHTSHRHGVDMDIYSSDRSATNNASDKEYIQQRSIALAQELIRTKKIKFILYNDKHVRDIVNEWAKNNRYPGRMFPSNHTHDFHFHIRIATTKGKCTHGTEAECLKAARLYND